MWQPCDVSWDSLKRGSLKPWASVFTPCETGSKAGGTRRVPRSPCCELLLVIRESFAKMSSRPHESCCTTFRRRSHLAMNGVRYLTVLSGNQRPIYDEIGTSYAAGRRPDPRIARAIHAALGDADAIVNVGAGAGSYEPSDRIVTAVEPSAEIACQRL